MLSGACGPIFKSYFNHIKELNSHQDKKEQELMEV